MGAQLAEVSVRARFPSTVIPSAAALLACVAVLGGAAAVATVAVTHHHAGTPASPGDSVVAANQTDVVRTTLVPAVAPLRHLVQPNLLVTAPRPLPANVIRRLRHAERAPNAVAIDVGTVRVNGHRAHAIAADLSAFRGFTPPPTAASDQLWQNLADGDVAVSYSFARATRLAVGQTVLLGSRPVRLGAIAAIGVPRVSVLVARTSSAGLGLRRSAGVLLSAPGHSAETLAARARAVMGRSATIVPMTSAPATYTGKPRTYIELYQAASRTCPGLSWTILAAIGQVESDHGRNVGPSTAGALGPMQFLPSTWASWGIDADGDHKADIMDPYDAVYSAARYLCYYSPGSSLVNLKRAIFAYNHADWYVNEVLALAKLYR